MDLIKSINEGVSNTVLYDGEHVQLKKIDGWYEYLQNKGDGVLVLIHNKDKTKYLCRFENCPVHDDPKTINATSLTGTIEKGLSPDETVIAEVREESGYDITPNQISEHGWVYPSKASNYKLYLYTVVIDEADNYRHVGEGDGSQAEEGTFCEWRTIADIVNMKDPSLAMAALRAGLLTWA